jgi:hypothetical protein
MSPEHQFIADYLNSLTKKYPGKVTVEINDVQTSEGRKKWQKTGLGCMGTFVNGKTRYEVIRDGKKENVDFLKRMGSFWSKEDFEAVVKQLVIDPSKPVIITSPSKVKTKPVAIKGKAKGHAAAK